MIKDGTISGKYPVSLFIEGVEYPLNDRNEKRLSRRLFEKYSPDTKVQEVVFGEVINTLRLDEIFNR